jgi:uncharacterized protein (TIGR02147 family)
MKAETSFYKSILEEELAKRTEKNPRYSLRAMAKAIGLEPGALSQFLSGKRIPSYKMAQRIIAAIGLSPEQESDFLNSLAHTHESRGLERLSPAFKKLKPKQPPKDLSIDLFRVIGDWYHYAILMLTYVEGFKPSPKWIASELSISEMEVKLAIKRLLDVGLVKEEDGTLKSWEGHFTTADKAVTTSALRRHQKQVLEKSMYSLENDSINERSHTSMTMAIDPRKMNEAKALIEEFTNKLSQLVESGKRQQVYEFHVGFFPLQKTKVKEIL